MKINTIDFVRQKLLEFSVKKKKRSSASNSKSDCKSKGSNNDEKDQNNSKPPSKRNAAAKKPKPLGARAGSAYSPTMLMSSKPSVASVKPSYSIDSAKPSRPYISPPNTKVPINIFNFNNYNIIKNEKEKYEREDHASSVDKSSTSPSTGVQNFFIFMRNKKVEDLGNTTSKENLLPQSSQSSTKSSQKFTRHRPQLSQPNRETPPSTAVPTVLSHSVLQKSFITNLSKSSLEPNAKARLTQSQVGDLSVDRINSGLGLNDYLKYIEEQTKLIDYLRRISVVTRGFSHKNYASVVDAIEDHAPSGDLVMLEETEQLITNIVKEIGTMEFPKAQVKKTSKSSQTPPVGAKEISHTNINFVNLAREVAKGVLCRSKSFKQPVEDFEGFFKEICHKSRWAENQKHNLFVKSLTLFQEQLIFEESLRLMQEKGINLEQLFGVAYERLGVVGKEPPAPDPNDLYVDPALELSGVSLPSVQFEDSPSSVKRKFHLDFTNLKEDSVSESCHSQK